MSRYSQQPARAIMHQRRITVAEVARRGGRSPEFVGQVLLGHAHPPQWLQDLLTELLDLEVEEVFTSAALAGSERHPGDVFEGRACCVEPLGRPPTHAPGDSAMASSASVILATEESR